MRQKNFFLNGGLELQKLMKKAGQNPMRIFTTNELNVATNNYADHMKIGVGGFGAVYKGQLEDGNIVAIKKSIRFKNLQSTTNFMNEIVILSQVNHTHIVRLLGCCLETKTPLLVYEFIPNGTMAENLRRENGPFMGWKQRLKVALQTSKALAYLHGAASPSILHRDVKCANVLLDENWDAKVADFGVSRLVLNGMDHVSTIVQGTPGYIHPEYQKTFQLTDKSDVYSLGVMLVEFITTLKPILNLHHLGQWSTLADLFRHHFQECSLEEIIDPHLEMFDVDQDGGNNHVDQGREITSSILSVASLAHRCLAPSGQDRPSMVVVEYELHQLFQSLYATNTNVAEKSPNLSYEVNVVTTDNIQYDDNSNAFISIEPLEAR